MNKSSAAAAAQYSTATIVLIFVAKSIGVTPYNLFWDGQTPVQVHIAAGS